MNVVEVEDDMWQMEENSSFLFPFQVMDDGKGDDLTPIEAAAPNPGLGHSANAGTQDASSASFSVGKKSFC
jgi:hypothetical protein